MDDTQEENQVVATDGGSAATAAYGLDAFSETVVITDDTSEDGMVKKLKRELQCPVCDQIPTSIPIPSCTWATSSAGSARKRLSTAG